MEWPWANYILLSFSFIKWAGWFIETILWFFFQFWNFKSKGFKETLITRWTARVMEIGRLWLTNVLIFMKALIMRIQVGLRIAASTKTEVSWTCKMSLLLYLMASTDYPGICIMLSYGMDEEFRTQGQL